MLSLATIANEPVTGLTRAKANVFGRPSILFRPHHLRPRVKTDKETKMVEPPGTAPGSGPVITRAFIAIVHKDRLYIGRVKRFEKTKRVKNDAPAAKG